MQVNRAIISGLGEQTQPANQPVAALDEKQMREAARDFEASYISQMLTYSGLADALSSGDGKKADAFTGFYIDKVAESIASQGGFGLAEQVYQHLLKNYGSTEGAEDATSVRL